MAARLPTIVERVLNRLKLRQLRLLVAVGEEGNIRNAARRLNISQPAATKMIQELELDFEAQLFERTNRGVIPTAAGEALIRHGTLIFAQVSNAAQELEDLSEGTAGRVVVGTLLAAAPELLPRAIARVQAARPRVTIKVVEGTGAVLMPRLRAGEIDMVVGRLPGHRHRAGLSQEKLFDEEIVAVAGPAHPLAGRAGLGFDDLRPYPLILPPEETTLRRQIDQFFVRQDQFVPVSFVESVTYLTNRSLMADGTLIGLMPGPVVARDIAGGTLARLDWAVPFGRGPVGVSFPKSSGMSPTGRAFLAALREVAAES